MKALSISPRAYLSKRRPHLFSDTDIHSLYNVDKHYIEYLLNTITTRSQEHDFEEFGRRLAERELSPNWRPQTGPVGGGDSKADAITYPIASELASRWLWSTPNPPSSSLWALTISAKKSWTGKIRSDIKGLLATKLRPAHIYCITNQATRDKTRANLENELQSLHAISVTILDRTWITAKLFEHNNLDLIEECLHVKLPRNIVPRPGPRDAERLREISAIESRVKTTEGVRRPSELVAEDFVLLARLHAETGSEKRIVLGCLAQAQTLALSVNSWHLQMSIAYHRAWLLLFWYEDPDEFWISYLEYMNYHERIVDMWSLNRGITLWFVSMIFDASDLASHIDTSFGRLRDRAVVLELDSTRPDTALEAAIARTLLELANDTRLKGDGAARLLAELTRLLAVVKGRPLVPIDPIADFLLELDGTLSRLPGFEDAFSLVSQILSFRRGEIAEGQLQFRRGMQLLSNGYRDAALSAFAKARTLLSKGESLSQAVRAMGAMGIAYEEMGLPWAAHAELLRALVFVMRDLGSSLTPTRELSLILTHLALVELSTGRILYHLQWYVLALRSYQSRSEDFEEYREEIDGQLAGVLLHASLSEIADLGNSVEPLFSAGYCLSSAALLFGLGHINEAETQFSRVYTNRPPEFSTVMMSLADATRYLPPRFELFNRERIALQCDVLGTIFCIRAQNTPSSHIAMVQILVVIETFFSTFRISDLFLTRSTINIEVRESAAFDPERSWDFDPDEDVVIARIPSGELWGNVSIARGFPLWCFTLLAMIFDVYSLHDLTSYQQRFIEDECLARLLTMGPLEPIYRALGLGPLTLDQWSDPARVYDMRRTSEWRPRKESRAEYAKRTFGESDVRHSNIRYIDLVDLHELAGSSWNGMGYLCDDEGRTPPTIGLAFGDQQVGRRIFRRLRAILTAHDSLGLLRVVVVEKLPFSHPSYGIVLMPSEKVRELVEAEGKRAVYPGIGKVNLIKSVDALPRFKRDYQTHGRYLLAPFFVIDGAIDVDKSLSIEKQEIEFVDYADLADQSAERGIIDICLKGAGEGEP